MTAGRKARVGLRRTSFTSLLLQARDARTPGQAGFPEQSSRGDERLCPRCLADDGSVPDGEGRLLCVGCGERLGLIP